MDKFKKLKLDAEQAVFEGWNFSYLKDRYIEKPTSWNYEKYIESYINKSTSLLDMGTGGGEFLSSLHEILPSNTKATEGYTPNIEIARKNLATFNIDVIEITDDEKLPFGNDTFDLIINRHESYSPKEIKRILKPNGFFITQQVGGLNSIELNRFFGDKTGSYSYWDLEFALKQLAEEGFLILEKREEYPESRFTDIGAIYYYLKAIPWQIPDFNADEHEDEFYKLYEQIEKNKIFVTHQHLFLIIAKNIK